MPNKEPTKEWDGKVIQLHEDLGDSECGHCGKIGSEKEIVTHVNKIHNDKVVQKIIEEIYTTGEYDFGNGSKIDIRESGIFKSIVTNALKAREAELIEKVKRKMYDQSPDEWSEYADGHYDALNEVIALIKG